MKNKKVKYILGLLTIMLIAVISISNKTVFATFGEIGLLFAIRIAAYCSGYNIGITGVERREQRIERK